MGNLIENAFDSFKNVADGAVREVEVCIQEEAQGLLICVEDTGCGIPPKVQQRMFEQGFSTKGQGRGTGLALVQSASCRPMAAVCGWNRWRAWYHLHHPHPAPGREYRG